MKQQITEEFIQSLTKRDLLALDVASKCGYFTAGHGYGTVHFPSTDSAPKKLGEDYQQHKAFRDWVKGFILKHNIKLVAAEDVNVGSQFSALRKLSELRGVLYEVCATLHVPLIVVNVTALKKFATGKGNASKLEMMEAAKRKYHLDVENDDNAGDAAHIFFCIAKRYNIN